MSDLPNDPDDHPFKLGRQWVDDKLWKTQQRYFQNQLTRRHLTLDELQAYRFAWASMESELYLLGVIPKPDKPEAKTVYPKPKTGRRQREIFPAGLRRPVQRAKY